MCLPAALGPILSFAVSAASTVVGFMAQDQQAKAAQEQAEQQRQAAIASNNAQQAQITLRQIQEGEALSQKQRENSIEEAKVVSEVELSGASANVSGVSLGNLLGDVRRRAATNRETMLTNTKMAVQQLDMEKKGVQAQAHSRIAAAVAPPRPSPLSLVAGLAGNALSSYNQYSRAA